MFAGVAPLPIIVGKTLKKAGIKAKIISSELNKMASAFAKKNVLMNKIEDYVSIFSGDSRKLCFDFAKKKENFDFILMPRPNLKESFLVEAMKVAKRGTIFYYHGFGDEKKVRKEILESIHKTDKKISELEFRKAGDIGVRQNRWSVKFSVR
jgi:tRNA G37 N-methylase Trm5